MIRIDEVIGFVKSQIAEKKILHPDKLDAIFHEIEGALKREFPLAFWSTKIIEELDLSVRTFNCLKKAGFVTIADILVEMEKSPWSFLAIRNFGERSLDELTARLKERNLYQFDDWLQVAKYDQS